MKKIDGVPQFQEKDLKELGQLHTKANKKKALINTFVVDVDSLNLWLRVYAQNEIKAEETLYKKFKKLYPEASSNYILKALDIDTNTYFKLQERFGEEE